MKIFIALLLLLGNVYIHAQSNYNELFTRGEEFRSKGLYTKALPYYEKAEKVVKANSHKLALFKYCGIILLANGDERLAFQKVEG